VLQLTLDQLHSLSDDSDESDEQATPHIDHDGPFCVYVQQSLYDFFGVAAQEDISQAMLDEARAAHEISEHDTRWVWQTLSVACTAPAGLSKAAKRVFEQTLQRAADRMGLSEVTLVVSSDWREVEKPSAMRRCDDDDTFSIPEPAASDGGSETRSGEPRAGDVQPVAVRERIDAPLLCELERLSPSAYLCLRDARGWYAVNHARCDWPLVIEHWRNREGGVRIWPVLDEDSDRIRVAFLPPAGAPEVYELRAVDSSCSPVARRSGVAA
jgi:hypothetical protein